MIDRVFKQLKKEVLLVVSEHKGSKSADIEVSKRVEDILSKNEFFSKFAFFSEEKTRKELSLPLLLLDPIDGTKEFLKGSVECVLSLSALNSFRMDDPKNIHWIWNFNNNDEFLFYNGKIQINRSSFLKHTKEKKYLTFFSRSDYLRFNLKSFQHPLVQIEPVGSIAYKLALMLNRKCDFVISFTNKHIWDICAGSMLLVLNNDKFSVNGINQKELGEELLFGPMYWFNGDVELEKIICDVITTIKN